jgi:hypothetical protein
VNKRKELELAKEAMVRQMAETEANLQRYSKFPEDDYDDLTVLRFSRKYEVPVKKPLTLDEVSEFIRQRPDRFMTPGDYRVASGNAIAYPIGLTNDGLQVSGMRLDGNMVIPEPNYAVEETTETKFFHYAALKVKDRWYLTGEKSPRHPMTWDDLCEFMVDTVELYLVMDDASEIVELS